jgi:hypothetical protein
MLGSGSAGQERRPQGGRFEGLRSQGRRSSSLASHAAQKLQVRGKGRVPEARPGSLAEPEGEDAWARPRRSGHESSAPAGFSKIRQSDLTIPLPGRTRYHGSELLFLGFLSFSSLEPRQDKPVAGLGARRRSAVRCPRPTCDRRNGSTSSSPRTGPTSSRSLGLGRSGHGTRRASRRSCAAGKITTGCLRATPQGIRARQGTCPV